MILSLFQVTEAYKSFLKTLVALSPDDLPGFQYFTEISLLQYKSTITEIIENTSTFLGLG